MMKCVILDDYQDAALSLADWGRLSGKVTLSTLKSNITDPEQLVDQLGDAEILLIMRERTPFPADLLARLPKLKLLVTTGMRNAAIDLEAAKKRGITVCGTSTGASPPVELTWALLLGLARHVTTESASLRRGGWQTTIGADLEGATLGIIGLGKIGSRVAEIGKAFGMKVLAWSQNLSEQKAADVGVERATSKAELLERSDFVTIHLVLSDRSKGLIDAPDLCRMRPSAFLVNTSRAAIVDQNALIRALKEGWIAGAGLDVYETEPLPADSPFRSLPNLLALPHLGYVSRRNYTTFFGEALEDIERWLDGAPVRVIA